MSGNKEIQDEIWCFTEWSFCLLILTEMIRLQDIYLQQKFHGHEEDL